MHESTGESANPFFRHLHAISRSRIFPARPPEGEKKAPSGARERVTEIVYMSPDLYHRVISPPTLLLRTRALSLSLSLSPSLSLALIALFFSDLSLPTYLSLSGLSLPCERRSVSRARAAVYDAHRSVGEFSRGRARPYSRASTSIFLRFIAARLRNASNAVHAA